MEEYSFGEGWVKLWRKTEDSEIFSDSRLFKLWCLCLMKATHKEIFIKIDGLARPIKLEPGQFITGRFALHQDFYPKRTRRKDTLSPLQLWRNLKTIERMGNISLSNMNNRCSVITIINWDTYQNVKIENEQPMNNQRTTGEQPVNTNKNVKNDKNVKKEDKDIYGEFQNVRLTASEYEKLTTSFGSAGALSRIENLSQYVASKGKKYSNHYATILSWERKNNGTNIGSNIGSDGKPTKEKCKKYDGIGTTVEN